ncbi:unnamed protein product [Plasmodium vivax]|uniref:(malaria parasite P. vivax) hypothetical protein n=1 Tax=Plasmodium vivax TaxID=5855 RepID=A0A8S4HG54_PLAVI|nr:unnamed protein product [Plasmodium vivax]
MAAGAPGGEGLLVLREVTPQAVEEERIAVDVEGAIGKAAIGKAANRKLLGRLKKKVREEVLQRKRIDYLPVGANELPRNLPKTKKIKNKKIKQKLSRDVRLAILSSKKLLANRRFKPVEEGFIRPTPGLAALAASAGSAVLAESPPGGPLTEGEYPTADTLSGRPLLTQKELYARADVGTKKKVLDLRLNLGPYRCSYSRNGKYLLATGEKGHITLVDTHNLEPLCELEVEESVRCSTILHNHKLFAVGQKKYTYIYDNTGMEINCIKDIPYTYQLEFLPFHFLLTSIGEFGELVYQDISMGSIITRKRTKRGPCKVMKQNKQDATIYLGHQNGHVTVWTPNIDKPVCDLYCHATPISAVAIHKNYLITSSVDCTYKLWDMRKLQLMEDARSHNVINQMEISTTGLVAMAINSHFRTYANFFTKSQLYLTHNMHGDRINSLSFQPFEDICCVGARHSIKSLLIPGAGLANIDTYVNNPYETKKQVRENEVRSLLDKLPPDTITFGEGQLGRVSPFASSPAHGQGATRQGATHRGNGAGGGGGEAGGDGHRRPSSNKHPRGNAMQGKHQVGDSSDGSSPDEASGGRTRASGGAPQERTTAPPAGKKKKKSRKKKNKNKSNSFLNSNVPKHLRKSAKDRAAERAAGVGAAV